MTIGAQAIQPRPKRVHQTLKSAICEATRLVTTTELDGTLRALVLTGSLARDEATFVRQADTWKVLGDAEFFLILSEREWMPSAALIQRMNRRIEDALSQQGIQCQIGVSAVGPGFLRNLQPHILGFELRACGEVVWGDTQILTLIPDFGPNDIPLEDGWRLLSNRMLELLEVSAQLDAETESLPEEVYYRTTKLYLDMATSFLLFRKAYEAGYQARARRLTLLAGSQSSEAPFDLRTFANLVDACTDFKMQSATPDSTGPENVLSFWREALESAHQLWRWELQRLTGADSGLADRDLLERWMDRQTIRTSLGGWLRLAYKLGWRGSLAQLPRWVSHGWRSSPRYLVYAAASELFFRLPSLLSSDLAVPAWLPVSSQSSSKGWRDTLRAIASNYHEFLEQSRA